MSELRGKTDVRDLNSVGPLPAFSAMNSGRYVLSQILDLVHWQTLFRLVKRYDAESRVRHFGCRQQFICMAFAQLTWREGLRDIADCLNAHPSTRYHLGFLEPIAKSTLADANEQRDWRLWEHGILRHIALNVLKNDSSKKRGIKGKQKSASWDHSCLLSLLGF